jgi:hypothetical protein
MLGLVMLGCAGVIAYFSIYSPLQAAARHSEKVSLSMKGAIMCPVIGVVGVMFLAMGDGAKAIFGTRGQKPSWIGWVIGGVLLVAGVFLYLWLRSELRRQGYQF